MFGGLGVLKAAGRDAVMMVDAVFYSVVVHKHLPQSGVNATEPGRVGYGLGEHQRQREQARRNTSQENTIPICLPLVTYSPTTYNEMRFRYSNHQ